MKSCVFPDRIFLVRFCGTLHIRLYVSCNMCSAAHYIFDYMYLAIFVLRHITYLTICILQYLLYFGSRENEIAFWKINFGHMHYLCFPVFR